MQSSKSESYKPPKRRRKRRSRTKFNDENCDDLSKDKSYQNYQVCSESSYSSYALSTKTKWLQIQVRPRQQSDNEARRRSPRNTPEAKESRIRSRSLGISDGLLNSETHYDYAQLTQQQLKMASHSLAEVNRKLPSVSWKPLD